MKFSALRAVGGYLPQQILSNSDLEKKVATSDEWIFERTGIRNRRIAASDETTATMGQEAARLALKRAGLAPQDIDLIIVATCTPDAFFPSTACLIQQALAIPPCIAFDIQAACSGFIYGLSIADQFIRTGQVRRALVIGAEVMSRAVNWEDRSTCVLFGDGAGAVILEASDEPGILSTQICADGQHQDLLLLPNVQVSTQAERPGPHILMQGNKLFRFAVNLLGRVALETLQHHGFTIQDLDWLIPHQANVRIMQATAEKLGLSMDKVIVTLQDQGNTSAASIPLALEAGIEDGRIQRGQHLLLEAFGGGSTWGTALIRY